MSTRKTSWIIRRRFWFRLNEFTALRTGHFLSITVSLLLMVLSRPGVSLAQQATLSDDAHTESAKPNKNFGASESIQVSGTERGFLKFKLTPNLPADTIGSRVDKATFKLFVSAVDVPGSFEIYRVADTWNEVAITAGSAPVLGGLEGTAAVGVEHAGKWLTVDITQLVKDWLDGVLPNNGVVLVAPAGGAQVSFDSKENTTTSHEARLEISLNHAATADTATNFTGSLAGDVTGTQSATVVAAIGGQTAAVVAGGAAAANAATESNTPNTIVKRDATGSFSAGTVNADTQYNIGGLRVLGIEGVNNLFAGPGAGTSNTTGNDNAFVGAFAGNKNTTGNNNAFFGTAAGFFSATAINNSFYGSGTGISNTTGSDNSFFGRAAGQNNASGGANVFVGRSAGLSNTAGNQNSFVGFRADGLAGVNNATAIGSNAYVTQANSLVLGSINGVNGATAGTNVGIGTTAPTQRLEVVGNVKVSGAGSGFIFADGTTMSAAGATLGANTFNGNQSVTGNLSATGSITAGTGSIGGNLVVDNFTLYVDAPSNRVGIGTNAPTAKLDVVGIVNTTIEYDIGNNRVLGVPGTDNTFVGVFAGLSNLSGLGNSFFGKLAGIANTTGDNNSFFGNHAGQLNTVNNNSFFGAFAGQSNVVGTQNSFFGANAGKKSLANSNSFFGFSAGADDTTGGGNSFFGSNAGANNTTGSGNSFFGANAGAANTTGDESSFFGFNAGKLNTAVGNSFFGFDSGSTNSTGDGNSFFGHVAGTANTTGFKNTFFGASAGESNTTGSLNTFFGAGAGEGNTTTGANTFVGFNAGRVNKGVGNSFFGVNAGLLNSTAEGNSFFGRSAGLHNSVGFNNSFFGDQAGLENESGSNNTFLGNVAGEHNISGSNNTVIGSGADVGSFGLNHATAIGAGAVVNSNNTVVLGRSNDFLEVPGLVRNPFRFAILQIAEGSALCSSDGSFGTLLGQVVACGAESHRSSLRYKTAIRPLAGGLDIVRRLRPITFTWRDRPRRDLGLAAEDVAKVEPLLVTYNRQGEVEGVKYAHLSAVLIDAVQQQQAQFVEQQRLIKRQQNQLEQQRSQIEGLKRLVCSTRRKAKVCQ